MPKAEICTAFVNFYKRKYNDEIADYEEKEKVKAYLFRKGFDISDINICMRNFSWENM